MMGSEQEISEKESKEDKKQIDLEKEKEKILHSIAACKIDTKTEKVAWLLNHYPDTRDSDITLQLRYWQTFEPDIFGGEYLNVNDLYRLTRLTSISRARAVIQNNYMLFLASPSVRRQRGTLESEEKQKAIDSRPDYPVFVVYADESGKNGAHLIVGSMWVYSGFEVYKLDQKIKEWRKLRNFTSEFHFTKISAATLPLYKELVDLLKEHSSIICFKAISVEKSGVSNVSNALESLFYHLLLKGIEHENITSRAPLPRSLQLWKDSENPGPDKLMLANLEDKLKQAASSRFDQKLFVDHLQAVDSKNSPLIQVADLFTGSINRLLNEKEAEQNHKYELARYFLDQFGFSDFENTQNDLGDITVHISL
jgi:hypothetical protein